MKKVISANKPGLDNRFLIKLHELSLELSKYVNQGYIPKSEYYDKFCKLFSMKREVARKNLDYFQKKGIISIVAFRWIKLNYEVDYKDE